MTSYLSDKNLLYYRLVALWAVSEAFAGGIMHALQIPFTGMFISAFAVFCITCIGFNFPKGKKILKAALLVCAFKFAISPHSPPTAYIAVLFQATTGSLLFSLKRYKTASAITLGAVALTESAIQRLLVLWLLYGTEFWKAVDQYLEKLTNGKANGSTTLTIALIYVSIHLIVGLIIGYISAVLAGKKYNLSAQYVIAWENAELPEKKKRKRKKLAWIFLFAWLCLFAFIIIGYANPGKALITGKSALLIFFRVVTIIAIWKWMVSPWIMKWLKRKWESTRTKQAVAYQQVLDLIPSTFNLLKKSLTLSATQKGLKRMKLFVYIVLGNLFLKED